MADRLRDQEKVPVCDHEMPFPYRIEEQKLVSFRCIYLLLSWHSDRTMMVNFPPSEKGQV